jgi:hypothetical protein
LVTKSVADVHHWLTMNGGAGAFFLITDIVAIIFLGCPFTFFTFSLAIVLVYVSVLNRRFLPSTATARALTTNRRSTIGQNNFQNFFLSNFVSPYDCKCFCGDKSGGVLLRPRSACRNILLSAKLCSSYSTLFLFFLAGKMGAVWHHSFATRKTVVPAFQLEHSVISYALAFSLHYSNLATSVTFVSSSSTKLRNFLRDRSVVMQHFLF